MVSYSRKTVDLLRTKQKSAANTAQSLSTPAGKVRRLIQVLVNYSAAPTYTGTDLKVEVDSGAGADYDFLLAAGTNNQRYTVYTPENDFVIAKDDQIKVTAPAGGATITSSVAIYTENVNP